MLKTIILGIVQGLTEFLPVSSSGHLVLLQKVFGMPETGLLLEILLHVGTLVAVLVVFWDDWWYMLRHLPSSRTFRLLVVATVPAVIVTLLLGDFLETVFAGWFLGISFLITAAFLFMSDWLAARSGSDRRGHRTGVEEMRYQQALAMGAMQAVAIIPGISRSGSTIVGGLASGVTRRTAAKFSFMMSAVATLGSLVYKLKDFIELGGSSFEGGWGAALLGMLAAAVSGYLAIRWMLSLIQRVSLKWFGLYTAILGLLVLADQLFFGRIFEKII
ncbi:undecaprenyl-diphosphate phosphatase [Eubacteriales bacterium OttesenSCG-928-A19]|nr:undecaprenyl-diphosphate phosphatase [Eubacteriales bacterium OttesenSCG-928-A19]